jgi:hypothetical protein
MNVWTRTEERDVGADRTLSPELVRPGEYFHSQRDLFRVERCDDGRALVEDCRTGELIDIDLGNLVRLSRVRR